MALADFEGLITTIPFYTTISLKFLATRPFDPLLSLFPFNPTYQ